MPQPLPPLAGLAPGTLAERFHDLYEQLAPSFAYKTREASAKPWAEVPENNRRLMTAVADNILAELRPGPAPIPARLLILDLDGTVRECTVKGQPCPNRPGQQRLLPGAVEGIQAALDADVQIAFATNQAGVALGYTDESTIEQVYQELFTLISNELGQVLDAALYACHHAPDAGCWCRKPNPGMLQRAMMEWRATPANTLFVGDRDSDAQAAHDAGCRFMRADEWRAHFSITRR